ncbi:MAG: hypothetical protein F6K08_31930 [Okeania sp. SIO1H6]|nr:hypothetical protein [Okeania sp. SIO1H6]
MRLRRINKKLRITKAETETGSETTSGSNWKTKVSKLLGMRTSYANVGAAIGVDEVIPRKSLLFRVLVEVETIRLISIFLYFSQDKNKFV